MTNMKTKIIRDKVEYALGVMVMFISLFTLVNAIAQFKNKPIPLMLLGIFSILLFISGYMHTVFARSD